MARRVELWDDNLVIPPALAARTAVLWLGGEFLDLKLPDEDLLWGPRGRRWGSPRGRDLAAAYLLPRVEAALRQELQRPADAAERSHKRQKTSDQEQYHKERSYDDGI
jgi:hypothetical protein